MTNEKDTGIPLHEQDQLSRAQRRQVKFSGLVQQGVIAPNITPEGAGGGPQFLNELSSDLSSNPPQVAPAEQPHDVKWEVMNEQTAMLLVALVDDSPYQSRDWYNPEEIDELAHTLAFSGQQEPIIVRRIGVRFELIAGHRRIRAARSLGWTEIKATIVLKTDEQAERATMVHNEGRKNLCDYEKAKLYQRAKARGFAKTQTDLACMFATKQGLVSRRLAMLELPAPIITLLEETNDLFGITTADTINQLLKDYPTEQDLIRDGVARLKEGAVENSIKGWVSQMLSAKAITTRPKHDRPKVITDKGGRQIYTARLVGRVIELKISAPDINPDITMEKLLEWLNHTTSSEEK